MSRPGFIRVTAIVLHEAFRHADFGMIMRRSAAVAYYAALSLAPLLVIAVAVAGLVFDLTHVRENIVGEMKRLLGGEGAGLVAGILADSARPAKAAIATIAGLVMLLLAATAVFVELQDGLNAIWDVPPKPHRRIWGFLRTRLLSAAMVISFGFLLLVSLLASTLLAALMKRLDLGDLAIAGMAAHFLVSLLVTAMLFAALFKFLPDVAVRWRDVAAGSIATAILFNVGQIAIGQYLGHAAVGSAYGAAGSLVVVLVWIYYSAAIVFFGAEMTRARGRLSERAIEAAVVSERSGQGA